MNMIKLEEAKFAKAFVEPPAVNTATWETALSLACKKIKENSGVFGKKYPSSASVNQRYPLVDNVEWTCSFWPGMLWQAWMCTGDKAFLTAAQDCLADFKKRADDRIETATHDLGFLYTLTGVAEYKLTGSEQAAKLALEAADLLMIRYHKKAGVIQAWGDLENPEQRGRIIIDCFMNLPLLFWASEKTGDQKYRDAALSHLKRGREFLIRSDASTFHTYHFDCETGAALRGTTHQGYSDSSCWARGQAWGIYGLMLSYRYTHDASLLEDTRKLAHYFLNRLPTDFVSYWDLTFTDGKEERDSSAAVIAAAGLFEFAVALPVSDPLRRVYENAALHIMKSLNDLYTPKNNEADGLLLHGVYHKPGNKGVDECTTWGDYYFIENLNRIVYNFDLLW